jgi:hypothetical protein
VVRNRQDRVRNPPVSKTPRVDKGVERDLSRRPK